MLKPLSLFIVSLFAICFIFNCGRNSDSEQQQWYQEVDSELLKSDIYVEEKENRINNLKHNLSSQTKPETRHTINELLLFEYDAFISDSAIHYINENLMNPVVTNNLKLKNHYLIKKADVSAHAGLFNEATEILTRINKSTLDSTLLEEYYAAYCDLHQYQSEYSSNSEFTRQHETTRALYIDSLIRVAPSSSFNYLTHVSAEMAREGNFEEALKILLENLNKYTSGDRRFSILASILADVYHQMGNEADYHKYLALSTF